jgi:hypothetical protein
MYDFHGFDPKTMSNDELYDKQLALVTRKLMAARFGKVDLVNQLQMMISSIDMERRERMFNDTIGSVVMASSPVVLETDAELRAPVVEEVRKPNKPERLMRRAIRTSKPVTS